MKVTCSRPLVSGPEKARPLYVKLDWKTKERKRGVHFCAYVLSVLCQRTSLVFDFGCSFLLGTAARRRPESSVLGGDTGGCCLLAVASAARL